MCLLGWEEDGEDEIWAFRGLEAVSWSEAVHLPAATRKKEMKEGVVDPRRSEIPGEEFLKICATLAGTGWKVL